MTQGSYVTDSFSEDILDEIRRLGVQVDLFWSEEQALYRDIDLPDGARILEVGSGPGFYIKKLASIFPSAKFVSLEYDETFAEYQREQQFPGSGSIEVEVLCGDVMDVEDIGEFDLVVSRMVLEHLPDRDAAFDKISSFTRDGGRLFLIDNDFSNHLRTYPRVDELDDLYTAYCNLRLKEGGNPYIGRELPRYFRRWGYDNIQFDVVCAHTNTIDKSLFLGAESSGIGRTLVKQGFLDEDVFKRLIVNWSKMARDPDNVMTREIYSVSGIKNAARAAAGSAGDDGAIARIAIAKPVSRAMGDSITPPNSEREKQIAEVWCEVLEISDVSTDDSFFDIGGESYAIPLVVEALESKYGVSIEITDVFEYPTIKALAGFIDGGGNEQELQKATEAAQRQKDSVGQQDANPFARLIKK